MTVKDKILATLKNGDATDRGFREAVYRQVFAAFEKSIKANTELSADDVFRRREQLVTIIEDIEKQFAAAEPQPEWNIVPGEGRQEPVFGETTPSRAEPEFVPSISREERVSPTVEGSELRPEAEELLRGDRKERRKERRKRKRGNIWVKLIGWLIFLGLVAWGGWWLWGEAQKAIETKGASIEEIIGRTTDADDKPLLPSRDDDEWVSVFTPADTSTVQGSGAAGRDENGQFLSIGGDGRNPVVFTVPADRLQDFAGQSVTFSVRARAQEEETQMAVQCDFGALGACQRLRYAVGPSIAEYLFKVDLANAQASGGTISIITDIEGRGRMLDVYSIMMTAEE